MIFQDLPYGGWNKILDEKLHSNMFDLGYPLLVVADSGSRSNSKGHHSPSRNLLNYHYSNSTVRFLGKESEDVFSITISRHATMAEKSSFFLLLN